MCTRLNSKPASAGCLFFIVDALHMTAPKHLNLKHTVVQNSCCPPSSRPNLWNPQSSEFHTTSQRREFLTAGLWEQLWALGQFQIWISCLAQGAGDSFHFRGLQSINSDSDLPAHPTLPPAVTETTRVRAYLSERSKNPLWWVHPHPGCTWATGHCVASPAQPLSSRLTPLATLQSVCLERTLLLALKRQNKGLRARRLPFGVRDNFRAQMEKEKKKKVWNL